MNWVVSDVMSEDVCLTLLPRGSARAEWSPWGPALA
jgi:hypothetical protein